MDIHVHTQTGVTMMHEPPSYDILAPLSAVGYTHVYTDMVEMFT